MNSLVKKVAALLPLLEARGTVYLFACAERTEGNAWDILLSSDWTDQDNSEAIRLIIYTLWPQLEMKDRVKITGVIMVQSDRPRLQELFDEEGSVAPEDNKVILFSLLGEDIRRAFIFRAQRPPVIAAAEAPANEVAV